MAWPAVVAAGISAASATGGGVMSYYTDKNLARQAQSNTRKNMRLQSELEQQSIRNSSANLRAAGISPALAAGTQPVNVSTSPSPVPSAKGFDFSGVAPAFLAGLSKQSEIENTQSATDLNKANEEKVKEETRSEKIENNRKESQDNVISESANIFLDEMKAQTDSPFIRGYIEAVQSGEGISNLGALRGFSDMFFDFSQKERDRELDYIAKEMDKEVLRRRLESDDDLEALVHKPYDDRIALYRQIALTNMSIYSMALEASLTENKRSLLEAQTKKLNAEIQAIFHHDPAAMWHAGDYSSLFVSLGYDGVMRAADGFGFGAGAALASKIGRGSPAGALKTRLDAGQAKAAKQTAQFEKSLSDARVREIREAVAKKYPNARPEKQAMIVNDWIKNEKMKLSR